MLPPSFDLVGSLLQHRFHDQLLLIIERVERSNSFIGFKVHVDCLRDHNGIFAAECLGREQMLKSFDFEFSKPHILEQVQKITNGNLRRWTSYELVQ